MTVLTKKQVKSFSKEIMYYDRPAKLIVYIRHDDDCGNGHNSFSVTGNVYVAREGLVASGIMHELIAEHFPEFKHLIKWHLTSTDGPMYYIENTLYWASQGNLDYARSCAIWPEAELKDFNEFNLKQRLPALMEAFHRDVESFGFVY